MAVNVATPRAGFDIPEHVPAHLVHDVAIAPPNTGFDPFDVGRNVFKDLPPVFYYPGRIIGKNGGWVVTRYKDIARVYQDSDVFSTQNLVGYQVLAGEKWPLIPLELDPPDHMKYRILLNPFFSPKAMRSQEDSIREVVSQMLDELAPRGKCDFSAEFARIFPVKIFLNIMGLPFDRFDEFLHWVHLIHFSNFDPTKVAEGARLAIAYLKEFIAAEKANPKDNLTSHIISAQIEGRPITDDEIIGIVFFLWIGGLDTVAATLSLMFRRLALDPDLQRKLRNDPSLVPTAIEEFLRTQPLVNSARMAKTDTEIEGVKIKAGDWVMCLNSNGNFDPDEFSDAAIFESDRQFNRHFTFAGGAHRCLGSHLARRELSVALNLWLERVPEFRIEPGVETLAYPGLQSVPSLPLVWGQQ